MNFLSSVSENSPKKNLINSIKNIPVSEQDGKMYLGKLTYVHRGKYYWNILNLRHLSEQALEWIVFCYNDDTYTLYI